MTTAAPTAAPPAPLVKAWTDERDRLTAADKALKAELDDLQKVQLAAARPLLAAATADIALRDQEASRLLQELAAATTGPERHRIELELDACAVKRIRDLRRRVDAAEKVGALTAKITRKSAAAGALAADLTAAEAALTQATADAADAEKSRKDLEATVAVVTAGVTALEPELKKATGRIDKLLGSAGMYDELKKRLDAVAAQDAGRGTALADAERAQLTERATQSPAEGGLAVAVADHERALAAVREAQASPLRLAAVQAAVKTVLELPDLPAEEQAAVDKAAAGTDDPTKIPVVPPAEKLENWAIKIPAAVLTSAVALVDAQATLDGLRKLDAADLLKKLGDAEQAHVDAVLAQLKAAAASAKFAAAVVEARDDVTVHEATAADRRALAVSGH